MFAWSNKCVFIYCSSVSSSVLPWERWSTFSLWIENQLQWWIRKWKIVYSKLLFSCLRKQKVDSFGFFFLFSIHFFHEGLQTRSEMSFKGPWFHARHSVHVPRLDYADVPGGNNDLNFLAQSKACMEHDWFLGSFWALLVLCSKPKWPVGPLGHVGLCFKSLHHLRLLRLVYNNKNWPSDLGAVRIFSVVVDHFIELIYDDDSQKKVVFKHVPRPVVLLISNFEMMPIHWINLDAENGASQGNGTIKNETWMIHQTTTILIIPKTTTTTPCEYSEVNFEYLRATWVFTSKCSLQSCQLHSGDLGCKSCRMLART